MPVLSRPPVRKTILTAVMALSMTTLAAAQDAAPTTGLGQAWPNAADVSANAHYHVYRFERDGVTYIQVNDLQGKVLAAVATTQGLAFALPIGTDAQNLTVTADRSPMDLTQVVYQDNTLTITAMPQDDENVGIMVISGCSDPTHCAQNGITTQ